MLSALEVTETDPKLKTPEWADRVIQSYRESWQPIVDPARARENMQFLLSTHPMDKVKAMFKDPEKSGVSFIRIAAMEKLRNILIAERDKAGVFMKLNAIDPTVVDEFRKKDKKLLQNRKSIEAVLSTLRAKIGDPPYKLQNEKFSGNVDNFDEIGLDDEDDEDVNYFFSAHWRLLQEIKGQLPLNFFVKYNDLPQYIGYWCNDILAKKAIAAQAFVNQTSGAIQYQYLAPENVKAVWGEKKDFKDAQALGFEKNVTVHQLIRHIGNEFRGEEDYKELMTAINHTHTQSYTGLYDRSGNVLFKDLNCERNGRDENRYCSWSNFNNFELSLGYIEFKSIDGTPRKVGKSVHGNPVSYPLNNVASEVESKHYTKEVLNNEVTYKAYFVPTSSYTQRLYKFGKLFHQTTEGGEDELSNYSICCYIEVGPTAVEVAKPYIQMIQEAWAKFEWMVRTAKPDGRIYNYESLVQIAQNMFAEGDTFTKVNKLMTMFQEGINEIYTIPTVNGERVGGGSNPYFEKKAGLNAAAKEFMDVINFAFSRIASDNGLDGLVPYTPSPNDGYKLQMQQQVQSRNATEYMSTMILNCLKHMGTQTLLMCQDIVKYKTSVAYRFLENALGIDTVKALEQAKFAHSRLGIFVESFNTEVERQEQKQITQQAFMKGEIDYEQYMLINSIDDPGSAAMRLAYEKKKAEKRKIQEQETMHNQQMELEGAKRETELMKIDRKGKWEDQAAKTEGIYYEKAHKRTADAMIERKQMEIDSQPDKTNDKVEGDIRKDINKKNLEEQKSF